MISIIGSLQKDPKFVTLAETFQATGLHSNFLLVIYMWIYHTTSNTNLMSAKPKAQSFSIIG